VEYQLSHSVWLVVDEVCIDGRLNSNEPNVLLRLLGRKRPACFEWQVPSSETEVRCDGFLMATASQLRQLGGTRITSDATDNGLLVQIWCDVK